MRIATPLFVSGILVASAALLAVACSSDAAGDPPDATPEAGTPVLPRDAAVDPPDDGEADALVTCGAAPYDDREITMNAATLNGKTTPLAAVVKLTFTGCDDVLQTDTNGHGHVKLSASVSPRSVKVESAGYIPTLFAESSTVAGTAKYSYFAFPNAFRSAAPGWADDKGFVVVSVVPGEASGPCSTNDGVVIAVQDHPELVVTYLSSVTTTVDGGAATTSFGFATIANVPPNAGKLSILANKPGCAASTFDAAGIGKVPIEAGVASVVSAVTRNLSGPTCGPGPYVQIGGSTTARSITDYAATTPLAGVSITSDVCPGVTAVSDANGLYAIAMTQNATGMLHATKDGYIDVAAGEIAPDFGVSIGFGMRSDAWRAVETGWSDTGAPITVTVLGFGTGTCATLSGVSATVRDHVEAVASYQDTASPPGVVANGTETTERGNAVFADLPAGTYDIDVTTSKTACKVTTAKYYQTGKIDSKVNARNVLFAFLEDK